MDEVLRKRLTPEEQAAYDVLDRRASFFSHLVVWPAIAAAVLYWADKAFYAALCFAVVVIAFPLVVRFGNQAGKLRKLAEDRYAAIMGVDMPRDDRDPA